MAVVAVAAELKVHLFLQAIIQSLSRIRLINDQLRNKIKLCYNYVTSPYNL